MRTILVTRHVYNFGQEQEIDFPFHGTRWEYKTDKDFCTLDIYNQNELIASVKHWQSICFGDEPKEGKLL